MLDASGFVRRSKVFAGNVREQRTLAGMLEALGAAPGALVVMDRGVATEACVEWLRDHDYRYLVVSRERHRQFDAEAAVSLQTRSNETVHMHKVVSTDPDEVRLYCYSEERAEKERGIVERFATRFETALTELHEGLARPRAHKRIDQVWQRIGRLKTKHSRVASHYQIPEAERRLRLLPGQLQRDQGGAVGGEEPADGVARNADAAHAAAAEGREPHRGALVQLGIGGAPSGWPTRGTAAPRGRAGRGPPRRTRHAARSAGWLCAPP